MPIYYHLLDSVAKYVVSRSGFPLFLHGLNERIFKIFDRIYRYIITWAICRIHGFESDKLKIFQLARLKGALRDAGKRVPYWRKTFHERNFFPEEITSLKNLSLLPIPKREDIKTDPSYYTAEGSEQTFLIRTSGSTGVPFAFHSDMAAVWSRAVPLYHFLKFVGMSPGLKVLQWITPPEQYSFFGRHASSIGVHDIKIPQERFLLYEFLEKHRPNVFWITPSILHQLAELYKSDFPGENFRYPLKVIFSTGEHIWRRTYLENFFQCPVFDKYASKEVGPTALECTVRNGLHICVERVTVEIVDAVGGILPPGKSGRVILTFFDNKPMPFIRYDTGDRGYVVEEACECGSKTPRLFLEGRGCYFLTLPNGARYPLILIIRQLDIRYTDIIKKFQVIQEAPDHIILKIVPGDDYAVHHDTLLAQLVIKCLKCPEPVRVEVKTVSYIEDLPSGKAQIFISRLSPTKDG